MKELIAIQAELKAPKNMFNAFGKYNYRTQEGILEAVKPLLKKYGCILTLSDETKEVAGIPYIEATAFIKKDSESCTVNAQAGIELHKKGMDLAQSFGTSSSYARKYALNGLFLIDDTADADATNDHGKGPAITKVEPTEEQFAYIVRYLNGTDAQRKQALEAMSKYRFNKDQQDTLDGLI